MKKLTLGFAALALIVAMTSCNKDFAKETLDTKQPMEFAAFAGKATKASEYTTFAADAVLKLEVYQGTTPYAIVFLKQTSTNVWATYEDENATKLKTFYYPPGNFTIVSNFNSVEPITGGVVSYQVKDVADQEDYLVCYYPYTGAQQTGTTTLEFKHALSQINFGVKEAEGLVIDIIDITVKVDNNRGDLTFSKLSADYSEGWDSRSSSADPAQISYVYRLLGSKKSTTGVKDAEDVVLGSGQDSEANSLMLLPQTLGNAKIEVKFTVTNKTTSEVNKIYETAPLTLNLTVAAVQTWLRNTKYIYMLDLTKDATTMNFTVDFETWVNYNAPTYDDGKLYL